MHIQIENAFLIVIYSTVQPAKIVTLSPSGICDQYLFWFVFSYDLFIIAKLSIAKYGLSYLMKNGTNGTLKVGLLILY